MLRLINPCLRAGFLLLMLLTIYSCTKEGLPGPQGPDGPAGEDGSGSGGVSSRIICYEFYSSDFSWEQTGTVSFHKRYGLKYAPVTDGTFAFQLPDSVSRYIEEGAVQVFVHGLTDDFPFTQLGVMPPNFYAFEGYSYTAQKVGQAYQFKIIAFDIPNPNLYVPDIIRFVVIPKTTYEDLIGN